MSEPFDLSADTMTRISISIDYGLKCYLQDAAAVSERSLASEIVFRLKRDLGAHDNYRTVNTHDGKEEG